VTSLVETVANSTGCSNSTKAHEDTSSDQELLTTSKFALTATVGRGRRQNVRKFVTLFSREAEETFLCNDVINTSDEDVEELILDTSESDFSLRSTAEIVVVVDANLTTSLRTSKINLNLSGKVGLYVAGRKSNPVIITNDLVPVTLTWVVLARSVRHVAVGSDTEVIVRKLTDANCSVALSVDHRLLLEDVKGENTRAAGKASNKDPVVLTRGGCPFNLRGATARWVIIVSPEAVLPLGHSGFRAHLVNLQNSIEASVTVASCGNQLGTSTNDRNPDTLLGNILASTPGLNSSHSVILHMPWERTAIDEVSVFTLTVGILTGFKEIDMEVSIRSTLSGSNIDVVSLAVLGNEAGVGAVSPRIRISLSNTAHFVTVIVDLKTSLQNVGRIASGEGDGLVSTVMLIAPPATTTAGMATIARLIASIKAGRIAKKNIREAIDILSEPALRVLGLFIGHDSEVEVNTTDVGGSRRNSNEVGIRSGKEDDLGTKTTVIII